MLSSHCDTYLLTLQLWAVERPWNVVMLWSVIMLGDVVHGVYSTHAMSSGHYGISVYVSNTAFD